MTPATEQMVFRKTNALPGRHISVTPRNSTNKHLNYGRTILNAEVSSAQFASGERETGLIVLSGLARVAVGGGFTTCPGTTRFTFRANHRLRFPVWKASTSRSFRRLLPDNTRGRLCAMPTSPGIRL